MIPTNSLFPIGKNPGKLVFFVSRAHQGLLSIFSLIFLESENSDD